MKKIIKSVVATILIVCFVFALTGCGVKDKFVGEWESSLGTTTYKFTEDGKYTQTLLVVTTTGTWTVDEKESTITLVGDGGVSVTYKYIIDDTSLTLTEKDSSVGLTYTKK